MFVDDMLRRLAPTAADLQGASVTHDLRQGNAIHESRNDDEKLTVRKSSSNGQLIDICVITTPAEAQGWTWGVDCLFAVVNKSEDRGLSDADVRTLDKGDVLVTRDAITGNTVLRARPTTGGHKVPAGNDRHELAMSMEAMLADVLSKGFEKADSLGMHGVAIVPPDQVPELTSAFGVTNTRVQSSTVTSMVHYIEHHSVRSIKRVVLLEVEREQAGHFPSQSSSLMAEALCRSVASDKKYTVSKCNDEVCRMILGKAAPFQPSRPSSTGRDINAAVSGFHPVVLRGTQKCLTKAVHEIKETIAGVY